MSAALYAICYVVLFGLPIGHSMENEGKIIVPMKNASPNIEEPPKPV